MSARRYFGSWDDREGMVDAFFPSYERESRPVPESMPVDGEILFASYGGAAYEGDAFVLYIHDGALYEVNGSHCSCYGLEDQWEPEATTWEALAMRPRPDANWPYLSDHDAEARTAYWTLVDAHMPPRTA